MLLRDLEDSILERADAREFELREAHGRHCTATWYNRAVTSTPARSFTRPELETTPSTIYTEKRPIRFQDVDAAGTLFYPRLLEYFSDAYLGLLTERGSKLQAQVAGGSLRTPIVHVEADYMAPLSFGDTAIVEIVGAKISERSFTLGFRVKRQDGTVAAVGRWGT